MDLIDSVYSKTVLENEKNLHFWKEYLKSLQSLDFSLFSGKLTIPAMVPVGSRILFRGHIKHTNEITVAIGADYFAKCSLELAEILRKHRIKDAQSKIKLYIKEKEYLENQMSFSKQSLYDSNGEEIIEVYSEEEEQKWREKHRENMRQYKMQCRYNENDVNIITDEELWNKLEELELQEELEHELENINNTEIKYNGTTSKVINDNDSITDKVTLETSRDPYKLDDLEQTSNSDIVYNQQDPNDIKITLLQQVIARQNELGEKIQQIKQKEKNIMLTENNFISKLDKMELLEELEDEIDRLDDMIQNEDIENNEESLEFSDNIIKRSVSFADEDDSETLEISFKHSEIPSSLEPYNPERGIQKPSDVYIAFKNLLAEETTSILKKNRYECDKVLRSGNQIQNSNNNFREDNEKIVMVKDVSERTNTNAKFVGNNDARPASIFKNKRMKSKSYVIQGKN